MYDRLTKSDIQKMEAEIEHRKLVVRKHAIEAVKEARAQGDLSENFEYYAANAQLGDKLGPYIDQIGFDTFLKGTMEIYNRKVEGL